MVKYGESMCVLPFCRIEEGETRGVSVSFPVLQENKQW